ncbi:putative serine threonine- kinase [Chlorella sorokiniana]|uniref:non-specific serine/threonine protein kinase n=1 Tax=Chlorella sorokiniana TaxID=3076 RepID=A0A2P6THL9_CHLSO|nr:putative serine threonine- kinase [Chlorella sorokiniana]|eukprot:PRW33784.1 putative serine threonine- kinase [Chlorella sorokiniana]
MFKKLQQQLAAKREAGKAGPFSGKQLSVGSRVVKVDRLLGEGGFATIYRCTDVESGETFALKHFILTGYPEAERDAATEVGVMERLAGCPDVVRLHEAAFGGPSGGPPTAAFVLMDYCPETLVGWAQSRAWQLDDAQLLAVALPVARAVAAMHSLQPPLAHRDLKAENVLLGAHGGWVLCDFGSASGRHGVLESARDIALEEEVVRKYTTPAYRAPELYDLYAREYIGPPVDVWALGVLLYLLAWGRLPFEGEAKLQVLNGRYSMPDGRPPALRALIKDCLTVSPLQRPTMQQVVARLEALAPEDMQQAPASSTPVQAAAAPAAGAAAAVAESSGERQPLHERVPSQGWADFSSDSPAGLSSPGSGSHSRRHSGSLASWATFSPKRAAEVVAGAAGAVAAGAGSFWSSFGEQAPSEPSEPLVAPAEEDEVQALSSEVEALSSRQVARPPAQWPAHQPAAPAPKPAGAAEVSPLSAGLARMTLGGSAATPAPAPPQVATPAASTLRPPPPAASAAARAARPGSERGSMGSDAEMLREHCRVLEQLMEEKNEEVAQLRCVVQQQAAEIASLRQRLQRAEQAPSQQQQQHRPAGSTAASAAPAATPLAAGAPSSTPASSRMGQDVRVQVPGSSDSWVSFSAGGGGEAPTPTLLQPAAATASVRGSSRRQGSSSGSALDCTPASGSAAQAPAVEEALRSKLNLSSASLSGMMGPRSSAGLGSTFKDDQQRQPPMRSGGSGAALSSALSGGGSSASVSSVAGGAPLRSYPVQMTPDVGSSRSAPTSAQPSPLRGTNLAAASAAGNGSMSPPPGSPHHSRPGSSLSGRSLSPVKHRRTLTAPSGDLFQDLDPLH